MQVATQAWWFAAGDCWLQSRSGLLCGLDARQRLGGARRHACHVSRLAARESLPARVVGAAPQFRRSAGHAAASGARWSRRSCALHRRKRFHKQRFLQLLRQIQRSTAALPDGVVILNAQREITWFNRTAAQLLDLRGAEDLGLRIDNLLRQPAVRALSRGRRFLETAGAAKPAAGADAYLSLQLAPYGEGQLLLLVRDVSRQMRLEAMRKDFVANASHELRSPLTVISGYLETLSQDPALDAELAGPVAEMRRQAERMTVHHSGSARALEARRDRRDRGRRADRCRSAARRAAQRCAGARRAPARGARAHRIRCHAAGRGVGDSFSLLQSRRQCGEVHARPKARSRCAGGWTTTAAISP